MIRPWLRFFRAVNLPTVPGDVLVGAAAVLGGRTLAGPALAGGGDAVAPLPLIAAALASVSLYMFGLADNDLVGAKTDTDRPIAEGAISLRAAGVARGLCLFAALACGAAANLPPIWWISALALAGAVVVYNRTKWSLVMGLCRGLNVACGGGCLLSGGAAPAAVWACLLACTVIWTTYIAGVTRYSEGEECDPGKKRRVGFLIGAIVYLQLLALLVFGVRPLLIAGAVLLVLLRFARKLMPGVSAS